MNRPVEPGVIPPEDGWPQDRKPKATKKRPIDQPKTVTLDGHDYVIDPVVFDDLRFLELYEDEKWIGVLRHMLGPEQWQRFYQNHADQSGRVTGARFAKVMEDFQESDLKVELGNF